MKLRRVFLSCSILFLLAGFFLWIVAPIASAQVSGPCTATMNGVDVNKLSTPGTALLVPFDGAVAVNFVSTGQITGHEVQLEFIGGIPWTIAQGADDGNSWSETVAVASYSKYGVGLYKVTGVTNGAGACTGSDYVRVTGKNPLTTPAGAGAAAATAIGGALMVASSLLAGSPVRSTGNAALAQMQQQKSQGSKGDNEEILETAQAVWEAESCIFGVISGAFLTLAYMLTGAGGAGAPAGPARSDARRVPFKLKVSISGVTGAVLAGLGTLVLAQQFAVFFPTIVIAVVWLLAAVVIEVLITSFARRAAVSKMNRKLAAAAAAPEAMQA